MEAAAPDRGAVGLLQRDDVRPLLLEDPHHFIQIGLDRRPPQQCLVPGILAPVGQVQGDDL